MSWTPPRTWAVGELVTAAMLNAHVRDNLEYLKGNAGIVSIANGLDAAGTLRATSQTPPASGAGVELLFNAGAGLILSYDRGGSAFKPIQFQSSTIEFDIGATPALAIDASRNVSLGIATPPCKLQVVGVSGGGMLFAAASAVTSIQTIVAAGTVTSGAVFWIFDHNNTGGANLAVLPFPTIAISASTTYVNTDTITVSITAGGAITVQRTTGTNGSHDISMIVIYR